MSDHIKAEPGVCANQQPNHTRNELETIPFWKSIPLDELTACQGVSPADNLDEIGALWPADDDPDALLQYILAERAERRKVSQSNE
jgi:hypothetical protein